MYVGSTGRASRDVVTDPALIDPALPVAWDRPDFTGSTMSYWPSYSQIDPAARAAYLSWLADGRRHPGTYIGHVFLFFYGLERRLLVDLRERLADDPEVETIVAEIRRLRSIYTEEYSFVSYASDLIDFVEGMRAVHEPLETPVWNPDDAHWKIPLRILIGIGRFVGAGWPIPPEWAFVYLRYHPEAYLRTPATRCAAEFEDLFKIRYCEQFGDGMIVPRPGRTLTLEYRTASSAFRSEVSVEIAGLPDLESTKSLISKLKVISEGATNELDAYSRFLGRRPEEVGTSAAVALLPDELFATHGGSAVEDLRAWLTATVPDDEFVVVDLDELVERWTPGRTDKLAKRDAVGLASMLGKFDVGVEPDVRFGASTPKPGSSAVLFQLAEASSSAPSAEYTAAMSLVHLTAVVGAADGTISAEERSHLAHHAEQVLGLDPTDRRRLEAHLAFLGSGKISMAGIKSKVEGLGEEARRQIGRFLIDVAAADGVVSPEEITVLTKLFKHLGLDEADVYRQVHALGSNDQGPVTASPGDPEKRWAIQQPEQNSGQPSAVVLDADRIRARLAETATVTALLTDIFSEDESAEPEAPTTPASPATGPGLVFGAPSGAAAVGIAAPAPPARLIAGLDAAHSTLAIRMAERESWEWSEAEHLAEQCGIAFLSAALEAINDAAFDACGESLLEGDDPVELNAYAAEEMLS